MERLRRSDPQALVLALRDLEGALVLSAARAKLGRVEFVRYGHDLELPTELAVRRPWPKRDIVIVPLRLVAQVDAARGVVLLDARADDLLGGPARSRQAQAARLLTRFRPRLSR